MIQPEKVHLYCRDGYCLTGSFYQHQSSVPTLPILICPATGIRQRFYQAFATWLFEQGYDVLCFDFRGIGESLHGKLKDSQASIQDWGMLDIPTAIDYLLQRTQKSQVLMIGHSAGGQLLGVVPNYHRVAKLVAVAGSTGYVKGLSGQTKWFAPVMFNVLFPFSSQLFGYGASRWIGMGENLPKAVARQWREFCSQAGYIENALGKSIFHDFHDKIQIPMTAIHAIDDEIATKTNVEDLLRLYPNAQKKRIELAPNEWQHQEIGHMAWFKRSHQNLWPLVLKELQDH